MKSTYTKILKSAPYAEFKNLLLTENFSYKKDFHFIFLCGAASSVDDSFRSKFLIYLESSSHTFKIVLAEKVFKELFNSDNLFFYNLAKHEKFLAETSDCILIFPESPGSFAEIGYFSAKDEIGKKVLVANNIIYQDDSFVKIGPINLLDKISLFQDTISLNQNDPNFDQIKMRISTRLPVESTTAKRIKKKEKYSEYSEHEKLFIICHIVNTFSPINVEFLKVILIDIFGRYNHMGISEYLAFLSGVNFLEKVSLGGERFYKETSEVRKLLSYSKDINYLKLRIKELYLKNNFAQDDFELFTESLV